MMSLLDRYLFSRTLWAIVGIIACAALAVVGLDLIFKLKVLTSATLPPGKSAFLLISEYYLLSLPQMISPLLPFAAVGGVLLALSPVLKRGEFCALWASGLSPRRIVLAPLFLSLCVGLLLWVVVDQLEPRLQPRSRVVRAALTGRIQGGRTWENPATKTHWMAERFLLATGQAPLIRDVKIAPPKDDSLLMVCADQLTLSATEGWILQGSVVAIRRQNDGRTTRVVSDRLPCTGVLELPEKRTAFAELLVNQRSFDSLALWDRLSDAHPAQARTFRAEIFGRFLKMLLPLACVMAAIPVFVRFENRQRLTLAAIQALAMSALPAIILSIACVHLDRPGLPTIPVAIAAALLAFVPGIILFWRWRI